MTEGLPISRPYNLARLGNTGDVVVLEVPEVDRQAIANWSGIVSVERFDARIELKKLESTRFELIFDLRADVTQSCVVTLEPVKDTLARIFTRELRFMGTTRHRPAVDQPGLDLVLTGLEEGPEEIESLHFDLAGPLLEEFVLSLEPYPRRPGVEFSPPPSMQEPSESPFAVLKNLK